MKRQEYSYMTECLKNGIRIYPILKYGGYYLEIEFNKTHEFHRHEIIKIKPGEIKYDRTTKEWCSKILELYEHFYTTKIAPKSAAA